MVPFTIFHRLSSLGSGGGVNAGTIPPVLREGSLSFCISLLGFGSRLVLLYEGTTVNSGDNCHQTVKQSYSVSRFAWEWLLGKSGANCCARTGANYLSVQE